MILTQDAIRKGASNQAGWNAKQLAILGISWPPHGGWLKSMAGKEISEDAYQRFLDLRTQKTEPRLPKKVPVTEAQAAFLRGLLKQFPPETPVDVDSLSKGEAGRLIGELVDRRNAQPRKPRQAFLALPDPEPLPLPADLPPEQAEFRRWARGVFQHGQLTMEQLCELHDERFGKPVV